MDAVVKPWPKPADKPALSDHVRSAPEPVVPKPSRENALAAVRTLIAYAGDNPDREGLRDTPKRVIDAYAELYRGYRECPADVLERTFSEIGRYDDPESVGYQGWIRPSDGKWTAFVDNGGHVVFVDDGPAE